MEMAQGAPRRGATPGRGAQRGRLPAPGIRLDPASAPSLAHPILWIGKNTALVAQTGIEMGHFET